MSHYCSNCGSLCDDNVRFCASCGAPQKSAPLPQNVSPAITRPEAEPELSMKWFHFVIWFQLFANCASQLLYAFQCFIGTYHGAESSRLYNLVPGFQAATLVYGVILLALGGFALYTRFRLSGHYRNGPKCYLLLLGVQTVLAVLFVLIFQGLITNSVVHNYFEWDFTTLISNVITNIVMILCNRTYFRKRSHLFVN